MDDLLNKTVTIEAPWIVVTLISGAMTLIGLVASRIFRLCVQALSPGVEATRLLELLQTPEDWTMMGDSNLRHNTKPIDVVAHKNYGSVFVTVNHKPVEHLLGWIDKRRLRKAALAAIDRNDRNHIHRAIDG